jgi:hypothetical protein
MNQKTELTKQLMKDSNCQFITQRNIGKVMLQKYFTAEVKKSTCAARLCVQV